jgi:hypothetical protein
VIVQQEPGSRRKEIDSDKGASISEKGTGNNITQKVSLCEGPRETKIGYRGKDKPPCLGPKKTQKNENGK